MKKTILLLVVLTTLLVDAQELSQNSKKVTSFDLSNLDKTVSPGDDFYEYSVGGWLKNNPIPGEYSSWGSFNVLYEDNNLLIKSIIDDIASGKIESNENFEKLSILFNSGMDTLKIEKEGYLPLQPYLEKISSIKNKTDFVKAVAYAFMRTSSPLFDFYSEQDEKNSTMMIGILSQGGLGLPERDYYTSTDEASVDIQNTYKNHIVNMFKLIGYSNSEASKIAETVYKIERELADSSFTSVELRDVQANYNKMSLTDLQQIAPNFDWKLFFSELGIKNTDQLNVKHIKFFKHLSNLIDQVSLADWKFYMQWNLLYNNANFLSSPFVNERFDFYGKYLQGAKVLQARWKKVLSVVNGQIGEILGKVYVSKYFPPEAKEKAQAIVKSLLAALEIRIKDLTWMTDETKQKALIKLHAFNYKIGYPDKWIDYSSLKFNNKSYFDNVMDANYFNTLLDYNKIGKPVDKSEWGMTPQTVNAYYNPVLNEIVFPAAILQPPFFDYKADDAMNYGAMGAVIGHEATHGFDDQGRQYDFDGNIRDWWTKVDEENFNARTKLIIEQFNSFVAVDSFTVNGELTQGENIADLGGLTVSFAAFKKTEQYKENKLIDGFTPAQRFFLSWAQVWRTNMTDEYTKMLVKTDVHSPAKFRVNGPFSNMPEFFEAFNLKEGDKMVRSKDELIKIW
ncbi:MAG: M13 family metallopeptidase [bacterium]